MLQLRHFAVPVALGVTMVVGVAGCASDNDDEPLAYESRTIKGDARNDVPASATLMKEGHEPLLFQAPTDGTVYVYNSSDNRLVYSGVVRAGQNIQVDPDHDYVTVDGRKVIDMKMDDFDNHQILFGPSRTARTRCIEVEGEPASVRIEEDPVRVKRQPTEVRVEDDGDVEVRPGRVKVVPED